MVMDLSPVIIHLLIYGLYDLQFFNYQGKKEKMLKILNCCQLRRLRGETLNFKIVQNGCYG